MSFFIAPKKEQTGPSMNQDRSEEQIERDNLAEDILTLGHIILSCSRDFYNKRDLFSSDVLTSTKSQLIQLKEEMIRQLDIL